MTILDLLTEALQVCCILGDAEPVSDSRAQIALRALVGMVDTANADPLKKFTQSPQVFTLQAGKESYTIGNDASMDFNTPRFVELTAANLIDISVPTYPIRNPMRILSDAQWAKIRLQNTPSRIPEEIYYDGGYTQIGSTVYGYGTIFLHGIPDSANQIELWSQQPLTISSVLTDLLIVPPPYSEWLLYGLCIRLYPRFGRTPDPTVVELYKAALLTLESANCVTPVLGLDSGLPGGKPPYFDARTNRQL